MSDAERIAALEARRADELEIENARLREFNELLTGVVERVTGLGLPRAPGHERGCRVVPPPRRARAWGRRVR